MLEIKCIDSKFGDGERLEESYLKEKYKVISIEDGNEKINRRTLINKKQRGQK